MSDLDTVYLVEQRPIDPHYPPHVVAVYANEKNALRAAEGDHEQTVRQAEIEDRTPTNDE